MSNMFFVGELIADMVESQPYSNDFAFRYGGCSYFGAKAASAVIREEQSQEKVHYIGPVSNDTFGDRFLKELKTCGVETSNVVRTPLKTTVALIACSPGMENGFSFYDTSTTVGKIDREQLQVDSNVIASGRNVFVYGSISTTLAGTRDVLLAHAQEVNKHGLVYFDLNSRPSVVEHVRDYAKLVDQWCAAADIVKSSDFDIKVAYPDKAPRDVAKRWIDNGAKMAVITFGDRGSMVLTDGGVEVLHSSRPLHTQYSVGAGDSFNAGFCLALLRAGNFDNFRNLEIPANLAHNFLELGNRTASNHLISNGAMPAVGIDMSSLVINLERQTTREVAAMCRCH